LNDYERHLTLNSVYSPLCIELRSPKRGFARRLRDNKKQRRKSNRNKQLLTHSSEVHHALY